MLVASTVMARPAPEPDNLLAKKAFLGGLALGAAKGHFLANANRNRGGHRQRQRFGIPKEKVALGVGVVKGLALASLLNNGK